MSFEAGKTSGEKVQKGGLQGHITRSVKGHTLLEMTAVTAILAFVSIALLSLLGTASALFHGGNEKANIEEQGRKALMQISSEIKQAGYFTDETTNASYPYIFSDNTAAGCFADYTHTPAVHQAEEGTSAFGSTREIVFLMAEDADGDGINTDYLTGEIEWSADEISYVLVAGADGVNRLERRVNNGSPELVARYVERLCFDDCTTDASVPYGQIRVTLHMRKTTSDGRVIKAMYSTLVKMRNFEE